MSVNPPEISADAWTLDEAISNLQQTEDPDLRYYAAWWLGRFRINRPEVIDSLVLALEDESSRSPDGGYPLRRNAARALGKLGETRVVPALLMSLSCDDYYVRAAAVESLGNLRDAAAIPSLVSLLDGGVEAATMMSGKPHLQEPYESILEALGHLGATEATSKIQPFTDHFVEKVRYAAFRAMYQLTRESRYGEALVTALAEPDVLLRRAALIDLGAIGFIPGAEAIASSKVESNIKLVALKGLLESSLVQPGSSSMSVEAVHVMDLMDDLL